MRQISRDYIKKMCFLISTDLWSAKWAIIFIIAYFCILKKYFYSLCPVVVVTGYPCPACGMTRAGFALLRFDFITAFEIQPFIYLFALGVIFFCINRYILMKKTPKWLMWYVCVVIVGMVLLYIWRMITIFPGDPPMTYYSENLIWRLKNLILRP